MGLGVLEWTLVLLLIKTFAFGVHVKDLGNPYLQPASLDTNHDLHRRYELYSEPCVGQPACIVGETCLGPGAYCRKGRAWTNIPGTAVCHGRCYNLVDHLYTLDAAHEELFEKGIPP